MTAGISHHRYHKLQRVTKTLKETEVPECKEQETTQGMNKQNNNMKILNKKIKTEPSSFAVIATTLPKSVSHRTFFKRMIRSDDTVTQQPGGRSCVYVFLVTGTAFQSIASYITQPESPMKWNRMLCLLMSRSTVCSCPYISRQTRVLFKNPYPHGLRC